ncbi:MAG TPA: tetratricopeptide repeat protein [Candidatus Dormibacteraeota bacterium]|nr:tetratricopeptide repeat protein [Candidatus Dormibacteraeota bacterium]
MLRWLASLLPRRSLPVSPRERALALLERGDAGEAEPLFEALLAVADAPGERAFLLNKRGVARAAQARIVEAVEDFTAVLALDRRYVPAIVNLGNVAFEQDRAAEALARYEEAIALDPHHARAFAGAAAAYKRLGRYADAVRAIRTARRLEARRLISWRVLRRS